jgi:exportin-7
LEAFLVRKNFLKINFFCSQGGSEKLELALLSFFEQFRKIYIGDQVQKTSKVYRRLAEMLGLNDESMVLSVIIRKVITNLKYWGNCEMIINKTLQLLSDLSVGYGTVRKLVKLEEVGFLLANHTAEHYPFLGRHLVLSAGELCEKNQCSGSGPGSGNRCFFDP